jgi:hypothetical protein
VLGQQRERFCTKSHHPTSLRIYTHGGTTPIDTLSVPGGPYDCSSDPSTGNLAVVFETTSGVNEVAVYQGAQGTPTTYADSNQSILYCGYDNNGNLFIGGYGPQHFAMAELAKGSSSFSNISLNQTIVNPGQIQWDGQYLTVQEQQHPVIYRVAVSGSQASVVGTTHFLGPIVYASQSWISGGTVVMWMKRRDHGIPRAIGIWKYPKGGKPLTLINGHGYLEVYGVTVSVAPSH